MEIKQKVASVSNKQLTVLCAMASNVRFTTEIGYQIPQEVWEDSWARILASWICEYVKHYDSAPLELLPDMAREKADTIPDEATADSVARFSKRLLSYHEEHSEIFRNYSFLTDTALKWIKFRNLEVLHDKLEEAIEEGNVKRAEEAMHAYIEVKRIESTTVDLMRDASKIVSAFLEDNGALFTLPGALGRCTGPLQRGDMFLIMGESGTGKTWMLQYVAFEGVSNGLNVLYYNLENSEPQTIRRLYRGMTGQPMNEMDVTIPYFKKGSDYSDDDTDDETESSGGRMRWSVSSRTRHMKGVSTDRGQVMKFLRNMRMGTNGGQFLLESAPPDTITVRDIENKLDNLRDYENFVPDILVVDYGDLLRADNQRDQKRDRINEVYLGLRKIALDRKILVISPTQSNREGYGKDLKKQNMSENIGNVNHTAILWGLSHSPREKEKGITRVRILKNRDGKEFADPIICIGNLDIGRIVMDSRVKADILNME